MKLESLSILKREKVNELYEITRTNFIYNLDILRKNALVYYVQSYQEMRMDLVSNEIYGNVDYIDFLSDLNNITLPLLITEGVGILYVPDAMIPAFRPERQENNTIREKISNERKKAKIDPNRKKHLDDKKSLPPSVNKQDYNPVKHKDGKVTIGRGIFKA